MNVDKYIYKEIWWLFLIIAVPVIAAILFVYVSGKQNNALCKKKYGSNWEYRRQGYNADLCINEEGESKYL